MGLKVSHMVKNNTMDNLNCIMCGECIEKCPKNRLTIHSDLKKKFKVIK